MTVGYLLEVYLLRKCYFFLYEVILIHWSFNSYLYGLTAIQDFNCSKETLENFAYFVKFEYKDKS